MKCKNCPALVTEGYEYPESYCNVYSEEDIFDYADGSCGCKHPINAIKNRITKNEEAMSKQYESIGEWYEQQVSCETAVLDALISALKRYECCIAHRGLNDLLNQIDILFGEDESNRADSLTRTIVQELINKLTEKSYTIIQKEENEK